MTQVTRKIADLKTETIFTAYRQLSRCDQNEIKSLANTLIYGVKAKCKTVAFSQDMAIEALGKLALFLVESDYAPQT